MGSAVKADDKATSLAARQDGVVMTEKHPGAVDRGPVFDGVKIGRPATGGLIDAGYESLEDLPDDLNELLHLHGVGPRAIALLTEARRQ